MIVAQLLHAAARAVALGALVYAGFVVLVLWAVRRGHLAAFGPVARIARAIGDPVIRPLERVVVRAGGNPQDAPLWLLGLSVVGGLVLVTVVGWLVRTWVEIVSMGALSGRLAVVRLASLGFDIVTLALLVRVIGSWFGVSPYARWMRPVNALTDWILDPLRRVLPTFGPIDLSPLVAYFLLQIARRALVTALL